MDSAVLCAGGAGSAGSGSGGRGGFCGQHLLLITLVWTSMVTGLAAATTTEQPTSDVTDPTLNDVMTSTASLNDVDVSTADVTTGASTTVNLTDREGCINGSGSCDNVTTEVTRAEVTKAEVNNTEVTSAELNLTEISTTEVHRAEVNGTEVNTTKVNATEVSRAEVNTTQELSAVLDGDTTTTTPTTPTMVLPTSSAGSADAAITSVTSDTSVALSTVTDSSRNVSSSTLSPQPSSSPDPTQSADQSTSDGVVSTSDSSTTGEAVSVSEFPDNSSVTVSTPSLSDNVIDPFSVLSAPENTTAHTTASSLDTNGTSASGANLDSAGLSGSDLNTTQTTTPADVSQAPTTFDPGYVASSTTSVGDNLTTVSDLPSTSGGYNQTGVSSFFDRADGVTSSTDPVQESTATTAAKSTTEEFVDPFFFHIDPPQDPSTPPPPPPSATNVTLSSTTGVVDTDSTTKDPSALTDWWPQVGGGPVDMKNATESNGTVTAAEGPKDPDPFVDDNTFLMQDPTSPPSVSTSTTPIITTTQERSWENATDNLILPDESKSPEMMGAVEVDGAPPTLPPVDVIDPVTQTVPSPGPDLDLFPVADPNLVLEPEVVKKPKPIVEPTAVEPDNSVLQPDVPAGVPDSSWWPAAGEKKETEGNEQTTSSGQGGPDLLDKFQMVFLVAPCVGALLAVIGACCALRCATANCRRRRKLLRKLKKQQKEEEKKRKEEEKKRQEEKKREKEKKKKAKQAEVTEENETEQKGHRKRKHNHNHHRDNHHPHHHHDSNHKDSYHHHHQHNGHVASEEKEYKGAKKSHK